MKHGVGVVGWRQQGCDIVFVVGRDQRGERRDIDRDAHVVVRVGIGDRTADRRIVEAEARRAPPAGAAPCRSRAAASACPTALALSTLAGRMSEECRLDECAESIWPSRICAQLQAHVDFHDRDLRVLGRRERRRLEFRHRLGRTHIGPDEAAPFARRIGLELHLLDEAAVRRLGRHLEHVAFHVHLPAVVEAAQPAFLVAADRRAKRGGAGNTRRARRGGRRCRGTPRGLRPAAGSCTGAPSGSATSSDRQAGIQCRRMIWPIGASPSTRHSRSFSSPGHHGVTSRRQPCGIS